LAWKNTGDKHKVKYLREREQGGTKDVVNEEVTRDGRIEVKNP